MVEIPRYRSSYRLFRRCLGGSRSKTWWAARYLIFPAVVCCLLWAMHRRELGVIRTSSDSRLIYLLYGVGGMLGFVAIFVSIHPPKSAQAKGLILALFGMFFFLGFLVTREQGDRLEKASADLKDARVKDGNAKDQYDRDVLAFQNELRGMEKVVNAVAKNSNNNGWNLALGEIKKLEEKPNSNPAPQPPSLLEEALGMRDKLCSFAQVWADDANKQIEISKKYNDELAEHNGPGTHKIDQLRIAWDVKGLVNDKNIIYYEQTYKDKAINLRGE
jgi:hypothetical protein